jgi:hypothetical protein
MDGHRRRAREPIGASAGGLVSRRHGASEVQKRSSNPAKALDPARSHFKMEFPRTTIELATCRLRIVSVRRVNTLEKGCYPLILTLLYCSGM